MNLEVQSLRGHHGRDRDHHVHAHGHDHELHLNNSSFSTIMVVISGGSQLVTVATSTLNLIPSPFRFHPSVCLQPSPYITNTPHNYNNVAT
jgi:hypothetical protein